MYKAMDTNTPLNLAKRDHASPIDHVIVIDAPELKYRKFQAGCRVWSAPDPAGYSSDVTATISRGVAFPASMPVSFIMVIICLCCVCYLLVYVN